MRSHHSISTKKMSKRKRKIIIEKRVISSLEFRDKIYTKREKFTIVNNETIMSNIQRKKKHDNKHLKWNVYIKKTCTECSDYID